MANRPWLDEVLRRVTRQGLPPSYVQRFAEELSDHLEDLKEENMGKEAELRSRLGQPEQVAEAAVVAYRRRSFLGRHPTAAFLVFGLSPIVSFVLLAALCVSGLSLFDDFEKWLGFDTEQGLRNLKRFDPAASALTPYLVSLILVVIPSILASVFYCKLATRLGMGRKWFFVSCVVLAAIGMIPVCSATLSEIPGQSCLRLNCWNPLNLEHLAGSVVWCLRTPQQLLQLVVPLLVGWWFVRRSRETLPLRPAL